MVYCDGTRLVSENLKALHVLAKKVGFQRTDFRFGKKKGPGRPTHPHYPVPSIPLFQKCLEAGAVRCSEHFAEKIGRRMSDLIRMGTIRPELWQ
jgi:hypothetical protein